MARKLLKKYEAEVRVAIDKMKAESGYTPGLATVLVGDNTASATYVRSKHKACKDVGIRSIGRVMGDDVTQEELLAVVQELNADPEVDGILVQLPLPKHVDDEAILGAIDLGKDVDGFHPVEHRPFGHERARPPLHPLHPLWLYASSRRDGR